MECPNHAGDSIDWFSVERMLDGGDALGLKRLDRLGDLVAELDSAHPFITPLDARGFSLNFDLKPDAADTSRLDCEPAGFPGNSGIGLVAADHGVERAMATDFLIYDDVDVNIALRLEAGLNHVLDRHDMAGDTALHVTGASSIKATVLYRSGPGIV